MIRELRDDDMPGLARVWRELRPDAVHSERGLRHLVESFPPRAQAEHWIAEEHGVVAWAFAHRRWWRAGNNAYVWIGVLPEFRGRGLGSELWQLAERHVAGLDVERVNADVVGDPAGGRFLKDRGFVQVRTVVISSLDPRFVEFGELETRRSRAEADGYGSSPTRRPISRRCTGSTSRPATTRPAATRHTSCRSRSGGATCSSSRI